MNTTPTKRFMGALGLISAVLAMSIAGQARATDLRVTIKVFNYSRYRFEITGNPVRFKDPDPFDWRGEAAPGPGKQNFVTKSYVLSKNGPNGNDMMLRLILLIPLPGKATHCLDALTYARNNSLGVSGGAFLGSDSPVIKCGGSAASPDIEYKISQTDVEIVIDRQGRSWN